MNKISNMLMALLLLAAVACNKSTKETPNGFKFKIAKAGDGVLPKSGEILVFDYTMKDSKDSVWDETYKRGMPAAVMIADSNALKDEKGMIQMFRQLSKGDSAIAEMPIVKFFKEIVGSPLPKKIDSTLTITYLIGVREITDREKYEAKRQELMTKQQAKQFTKDIEIIDKFLAEKGITTQQTADGVRYVITQAGKGENGNTEQTVKVNYAGYLLNGKYFDTNVKSVAQEKGLYDPRNPYASFDVVIDRSQVIKGWHSALKTLNKGAKGTFYIPSTLGYGPQRLSEVIGENSILVFDIEVTDIVLPGAAKPTK